MAEMEQEKQRLAQEVQALAASGQAAEADREAEQRSKQNIIDAVEAANAEERRELENKVKQYEEMLAQKDKEVITALAQSSESASWRALTSRSAPAAAGDASNARAQRSPCRCADDARLLLVWFVACAAGSSRALQVKDVTKDSDVIVFSPDQVQRILLENDELKGVMTMLDDQLKHQVYEVCE